MAAFAQRDRAQALAAPRFRHAHPQHGARSGALRLSDRAAAERLADQTEAATDKIGVRGTPSFTINGTLQNFYDWPNLRAALDALTQGFS